MIFEATVSVAVSGMDGPVALAGLSLALCGLV